MTDPAAPDATLMLLVEGKDEVGLCNKLIEHCSGRATEQIPPIQVKDVGGVTRFKQNLHLVLKDRDRRDIQGVGVIRDANGNPPGAFDSVCHAIRSASCEAPSGPGEFSSGKPSLGVFIVPDGERPGAIESLCRESVAGEPAAECASEYLDCLRQRQALPSSSEDKAFVHAYLAAQRDPLLRVGEGAQKGIWDFDSPAFAPLVQFILELASMATPR